MLANKGNNNKEPAPSTGLSEEPEQQESQKPLHKPTQTKFTWKSMWQRDTFPRLVPAFGLLGEACCALYFPDKIAVQRFKRPQFVTNCLLNSTGMIKIRSLGNDCPVSMD